MKHWLPFLILTLFANLAAAEPPTSGADTEKSVKQLVDKKLVKPLKRVESKRSRFSRAAVVPVQRRVRVLDTAPKTDKNGKRFVRFAIDERRFRRKSANWAKGRVVGCAYLEGKDVFVQRGEGFVPARRLLGKKGKAPAGVCQTAPAPTQKPAKLAKS